MRVFKPVVQGMNSASNGTNRKGRVGRVRTAGRPRAELTGVKGQNQARYGPRRQRLASATRQRRVWWSTVQGVSVNKPVGTGGALIIRSRTA